tara:strand:- start:645 stop:839 length:195 start_codon:yes stop_codon:yes gene_type:complete
MFFFYYFLTQKYARKSLALARMTKRGCRPYDHTLLCFLLSAGILTVFIDIFCLQPFTLFYSLEV